MFKSIYASVRDIKWLILVFLVVDIFLLCLAIAGTIHNFVAVKYIYYLSFLFFPGVVLMQGVVRYLLILRFSLSRKKRDAGYSRSLFIIHAIVSLLIFAVYIYATHIEPYQLRVRFVTLHSVALRASHKPLRILHISDIQADSVGAYEKKVFVTIKKINPDLILHSGDMVQAENMQRTKLISLKLAALFKKLKPKLGIFNVMGNTDYAKFIALFDSCSGVRTLVDEKKILTWQGVRIELYGLSLAASLGDISWWQRVWSSKKKGASLRIVFGHVPNYIIEVRKMELDLCLAGHTHGGQIRIPLLGPMLTSSRLPQRYTRGFRRWGKIYMNVSAGVGSEHHHGVPAIRFNCPPEMTLITIKGVAK